MPERRVLIVAGEASSDAHGAGILRALQQCGLEVSFYGVGGPALEAAGMRLLARYDDLAVVGLFETIGVLPRAIRLLGRLRAEITRRPPDLFLPIDSPEINLRLTRSARRSGVPVVYFIAPQLWAWRARRVRILRDCIRELLVLFPFEEEWFERRGVPTTYVGHPMVDAARAHSPAAEIRRRSTDREGQAVGLLLPGSRPGEVRRHLPQLASAAKLLRRRVPGLRWVLRMADDLDEEFYQPWAAKAAIELRRDPLFDLSAGADVAVAASGTASFEVSLMGTPTVVVYRMNRLTWWLARRMVRVPWVSMTNLAAGKPVLPELLQDACTPERIAAEVEGLIGDPVRRARMRQDLLGLREGFGKRGAYARAAERVMIRLEESKGDRERS